MKILFHRVPWMLVAIAWCIARSAAAEEAWSDILDRAKGQTVYWNAWGGDERVNDYIAWTTREVKRRFNVRLRHVKLTDTGEAVARIVAEKAAGRRLKGSTDLLWINGENFSAMKQHGLLYGPFVDVLPHYRLVDTRNELMTTDFTVPVDGLEAPWSLAQFVFVHDRVRVPTPPRTAQALMEWARAHPGRFTYPQPPDFLGTTFLKQLLIELVEEPSALKASANEAEFRRLSAPLWKYLDGLHPVLWRQGRAFPASGPALGRMLGDAEIDIAICFGAEWASSSILAGQLPDTTRAFVFEHGTVGNASFLAIPFNSSAREGAQVVINFLLSPEAQARKADPKYLGSRTVLSLEKLSTEDRAMFEKISPDVATLSPTELGQPLPEPHPYWMERLEKEWQSRYGAGR